MTRPNKDTLPAHQLTVYVEIGTMILECKLVRNVTILVTDAVEHQHLSVQLATVWPRGSFQVRLVSVWMGSIKLHQLFSSVQSAHIHATHVSPKLLSAQDVIHLSIGNLVEQLVLANLSISRIAPNFASNAILLAQLALTVLNV